MRAIPVDKQGHAWAGWAIVATLLPYAGGWALLGAIALGALKELHDHLMYGDPDARDFWATVAGGVAGGLADGFIRLTLTFFTGGC